MSSNRTLLPLLFALVASLMSATAVKIFSLRLSDISFLVFLAMLCFAYRGFSFHGPRFYLAILFVYVCARSISSLFTGSPFNDDVVFVPAAMLSALLYLTSILSKYTYGFLANFSKFFVCSSLAGFGLWILGFDLPFVDYEFEFERFSFLSNNPNQFALFLAIPLAFSVSSMVGKGRLNFNHICFFGFVFALMVASVSKALILSSMTFFLVCGFYSLIVKNRNQASYFAKILKAFILLLSASLIIYASKLTYVGIAMPGSQIGQGDTRVRLWENGVSAWMDAFTFGNGPGHFSGYEAPYDGYEAHNFFIDFAASYGATGLFLFILFIFSIIFPVFRSRNVFAVALIFINLFLSLFHFYGRQPVFWIILVAAYSLAVTKSNAVLNRCAE